jgi:hypothetical protein
MKLRVAIKRLKKADPCNCRKRMHVAMTKRLTKLARRLKQADVRKDIRDVFLATHISSIHGMQILTGARIDDYATTEYQYETPFDAIMPLVKRYRHNRRALRKVLTDTMIVAYRRTGEFTDKGAERLQFDHVHGRAFKYGDDDYWQKYSAC